MKPWKLVTLLGILAFVAIVIATSLGSISIRKKEVSQQATVISSAKTSTTVPPSQLAISSSSEVAQKSGDVASSNVKNSSSVSSTTSSTSSVASSSKTTTESSEVEKVKTEQTGGSIKSNSVLPIEAPDISKVLETKGFIEKKEVVVLEDTYLYSLVLSMSVEGYGTINVPFFVQASTYTGTEVGALVAIKYSVAPNGKISIIHVSTI